MKDLSIFLLKKSLASKMKRGVRSACNGVVSTTTMNQSKGADVSVSCVAAPPSLSSGCYADENNPAGGSPKTLEDMLLQLDIEEAAARRAKLDEYGELNRRMSCANSSDVLSSARNALSHYPRFSLDGKDAMYRSFRNGYVNLEGGRSSIGGGFRREGYGCGYGYELDVEKSLRLPPTVAGECVVWCRPGVVAQLMGLEAVPVPVPSRGRNGKRLSFSDYRKRSLRRMGRYELEKDRFAVSIGGCKEGTRRESAVAGYCTTKPASMVLVRGGGGGGGVRGGRGL